MTMPPKDAEQILKEQEAKIAAAQEAEKASQPKNK